ncbi:MAG: Holo-[acyl-carrier-protein] synthase [Planctomycetota bacterium]|jgi:holo-[acyl-carrier protein] synthase
MGDLFESKEDHGKLGASESPYSDNPCCESPSGAALSVGNVPQGVVGIGTDIIECDRIAQMMQKHGETFIQRVFTAEEIDYCSRHRTADQHYAGRWAAKEAVLKVLGTGWAKGIQWTDVEVVRDVSGAPSIRLRNRAAEIAKERGIREVLISISHCKAFATAFAVGVR